MAKINKAYVYNNSYKEFEDETETLNHLVEMKHNGSDRFATIRDNLYMINEYDPKYKIGLWEPKDKEPFLKRIGVSDLEKKGFSSVCESMIHNACKRGIANAEKLKIRIDDSEYIISKSHSEVEKVSFLMEREFESDCEYTIADISPQLESLIKGKSIFFEIHHKSRVNDEKGIIFKLSRMPMIEFDIQDKYLPRNIIEGTVSFDEMIEYFKVYYENINKHYIRGVFYKPFISTVEWVGNRLHMETSDGVITALVFRRNDEYRIRYSDSYGRETYDNYFFDKKMMKNDTAKKFAEYRLSEHILGNKRLWKH